MSKDTEEDSTEETTVNNTDEDNFEMSVGATVPTDMFNKNEEPNSTTEKEQNNSSQGDIADSFAGTDIEGAQTNEPQSINTSKNKGESDTTSIDPSATQSTTDTSRSNNNTETEETHTETTTEQTHSETTTEQTLQDIPTQPPNITQSADTPQTLTYFNALLNKGVFAAYLVIALPISLLITLIDWSMRLLEWFGAVVFIFYLFFMSTALIIPGAYGGGRIELMTQATIYIVPVLLLIFTVGWIEDRIVNDGEYYAGEDTDTEPVERF